MLDLSHRSTAKSLFGILCDCSGSVLISALPYCLLNVGIMFGVNWLSKHQINIAFSMQGHTLMTLLISYLVVAKINLSYERYMKARKAIGDALSRLRELNQLAMSYTFNGSGDVKDQSLHMWRLQLTERIIEMMDCMMRVIRDQKHSQFLARDEMTQDAATFLSYDDPLLHVQAMRLHLYHGSATSKLALLERTKLMEDLNKFVENYRELLVLSSTPLPLAFLQLGRTFVLIFTFTMPFVLRGIVEEHAASYAFIFVLTYGFIGLELVSVQLCYPFGDGRNDLNVMGMRQSLLRGIKQDLELFGETMTDRVDRRMEFSKLKARMPTLPPSLFNNRDAFHGAGNINQGLGDDAMMASAMFAASGAGDTDDSVYISMTDVV